MEDFGGLNMFPLIILPSLGAIPNVCFNVTITDDEILEDDEDFVVMVSNTDDSAVTNSPAFVTIMDNDG